MPTALVTGGAGFIGSHLARRLLNENWKVFVVDNLSTGFESNIPTGAEFLQLDLSQDGFIEQLPNEQLHAVFHLAAQSSGEISFDDPMYDLKTNCLSTLMLLDWCYLKEIRRFIFTSSMSIYGDQYSQPVNEEAKPKPKSFYGVGKLASESYCNVYSNMGIQTTALRLFNVYGPGQNMGNLRQGMVSIYMAYLLKNEPVLVKGAPDRYRDLVYIDDVIDAYMMCLNNQNSFGKAYNIATGFRTHVHELVRAEIVAFGHDPNKYPVTYQGSTPGDTFGIVADISLIGREVGWQPKYTLQEGLRTMVSWAKTQMSNQLTCLK